MMVIKNYIHIFIQFIKTPIQKKLYLTLFPVIILFFLFQGKVINAEENNGFSGNINLLWEQAKEYYQDGNYSESLNLWQQLESVFDQKQNYFNQAVALSNIALNYQQIGEWNLAEEALLKSLNLLEKIDNTPEKLRIYAQTLDIQGYKQFHTGQLEQALETWQKTEVIYEQLQAEKLLAKNLINQAQTLQKLGFYPLACKSFLKSLKFPSKECEISSEELDKLYSKTLSSQEVKSLVGLANLWRILGKLAQSEQILNGLLSENQQLSPTDESLIFFNLGNTQMAIASRFRYLKDSFQNKRYSRKALDNFQQASFTRNLIDKTQAKTNQLNLLIQTQQWEQANNIVAEILPLIKELEIKSDTIYLKNNFVKNIICLEQKKYQCFLDQQKEGTTKYNPINPKVLNISIEILTDAINEANSIGDLRAKSYSLGNLGLIYALNENPKKAKKTLEKALNISQSIQADDISYQWQWHLGRLLKNDQRQQAIIYYENSVNLLNKLRSDLVTLNQNVQFSFQENVEPVYREYVDLLLKDSPNQKQLKKSREVMESLKIAELNNFFGDNCIEVENTNSSWQNIDNIDPSTAIFYTIILPDRIEVITSLPGENLKNYKTYLSKEEIENELETIIQQISNPNNFSSQLLKKWYDYIVAPIEKELKAKNINNLVFISDGLLRNIPLSVLYDGAQYLLDKYSVAIAPSLQLIQSRSNFNDNLNIIAAGLSDARYGFSELPGVEQELQNIQEITNVTVVLFNESFQIKNFTEEIKNSPYSVVHLATHGQFSSNAENTFILAYDGPIDIYELDQVLRIQKNQNNPIELLILSACETAKGDNRAALGLAGVAIKAGAKSTIASLWPVNDDSTQLLMTKFYEELTNNITSNLNNPLTKAEALRRAQKAVKDYSQDYAHPFYWSAFVLVGNWQ